MYLYDYKVVDTSFDMQLAAETSTRSHYKITFPSPCPVRREERNTVYGDLFMPKSTGRVPLVILTHAFGDASLAPCLTLARLLVRQGIAAFVWYLPIDSCRLPESLKGFSPKTPREWLDISRSSVIEIRRVVDLLSNREEIDKNKIMVAGMSFGGVLSSIAMAVDKRISAGVLVVVGGNMAELSWGGKNVAVASSGHNCSREECLAAYSKYPEYLNEVARKGIENVIPAKECFLFDPLTFASHLRSRPIVMINGKDDEAVSEKSTNLLWEACGKPRLTWVPDGHVATYCKSELICNEITNLLSSVRG